MTGEMVGPECRDHIPMRYDRFGVQTTTNDGSHHVVRHGWLEQRSGKHVPVEEAVMLLGMSRSTIDRYRRRGLLDSYRPVAVDRRVYIDLDQLRELRSPGHLPARSLAPAGYL